MVKFELRAFDNIGQSSDALAVTIEIVKDQIRYSPNETHQNISRMLLIIPSLMILGGIITIYVVMYKIKKEEI